MPESPTPVQSPTATPARKVSAMSKSTASGNVIVLGVCGLASVVVVSTVTLVVLAPTGSDVAGILTILLGFLGTTITMLVTLSRVQGVAKNVDYLANGGMDAKVRAGVADVLRADLVRAEVAAQLDADRKYRDAGPDAADVMEPR